MKYAGIDVGKDTLQVMIEGVDTFVVENSAKGHRRLVKRLCPAGVGRVVLEATGPYSLGVATAISEMDNCSVMVANPRHTKSFALSIGQRGKSDVADAKMLLRYVQSVDFREWKPLAENHAALRSVMRRRDDLVQIRMADKTRLSAEKAYPCPNDTVLACILKLRKELDSAISALETEAIRLAKLETRTAKYLELFTSVPGIGAVTALTIISEAGHLIEHASARQLVAYAGLDPRPWQSGTMNGRRHISRQGNKRLRCALYLAAWTTTRFSENVKAWRQRMLDRGKAPKLSDVAVARRLLHALVGMVTTNTKWDGESFFSLEKEVDAA